MTTKTTNLHWARYFAEETSICDDGLTLSDHYIQKAIGYIGAKRKTRDCGPTAEDLEIFRKIVGGDSWEHRAEYLNSLNR